MKDNRIRVLFVGPLPPPVHGSAVVSEQIKNSTIINNAFRCDWINLSTSRKMTEAGQFSLAKVWRVSSSFMKEFWLLLTRRYKLCYLAITCRGGSFIKDAPFVLLCKLFGRKVIIHQHNKGMSNFVDKWPFKWLLPLCYKNAHVVLLSWNLYPDIEKVVLKDNVLICPNGIKVIDYNNEKNNTIVPRLLFLSNLLPSKGVYILLDALKMIKERNIPFLCDFVGGETKEIDSNYFDKEAQKRGLQGLVIYHGKKFGKDKEAYFKNADIFIHPTLDDCFPLVLLEAMQFALPIVTTNEGGIPDIVNHGVNGLICEKQNVESLANSICLLLENPSKRQEMGKKGLELLNRMFTEEIFERRICDILTLVSENRCC